MTDAGDMTDAHLTERQLASYLDRALDSRERSLVEAHLEGCDECRDELLEASGIAATAPVPRRRWVVAAAAAAAVAAVVLLLPTRRPGGEVIRGPDDGEGVPGVQPVSPAQGGQVPQSAVRLTWRRAPAAELYRITVTDAAGAPVWSDSTSDTTLAPQATLRPGKYYWVVDALLADGRAATTGNLGFTVVP